MSEADRKSSSALGPLAFFKRDVTQSGRGSGPQTSEEWWDYLCAQADQRRLRVGLPTGEQVSNWNRPLVLPREPRRR